MINFIGALVAVGFGYLLFRIIKPKTDSGGKEIYYARVFLAWALFVSTSLYIQPFTNNPSVVNIIFWFKMSIPFSVVAIIAGFLYGKFR